MPRYDGRYDNTRLYVGRLSSRTRSRDLERIFNRYGRVRYMDMKNEFAFVEFSDPQDADDARYSLNGWDVDGSRITVEFTKGDFDKGENILKVGEAEKNLSGTGVNVYAQLIDDVEGLEKIENLQSHDNNEIYEKAVKIVETYWLEEDDEPLPLDDASQSGFQFGGNVTVPSG